MAVNVNFSDRGGKLLERGAGGEELFDGGAGQIANDSVAQFLADYGQMAVVSASFWSTMKWQNVQFQKKYLLENLWTKHRQMLNSPNCSDFSEYCSWAISSRTLSNSQIPRQLC